jgi:hypothetical protein
MRTATMLLLAALGLAASSSVGHAALSQSPAEFMIRDCVARFGHERVRACEVVAGSATHAGVNPTTATCRAAAKRRDIQQGVTEKLCGYYSQEKRAWRATEFEAGRKASLGHPPSPPASIAVRTKDRFVVLPALEGAQDRHNAQLIADLEVDTVPQEFRLLINLIPAWQAHARSAVSPASRSARHAANRTSISLPEIDGCAGRRSRSARITSSRAWRSASCRSTSCSPCCTRPHLCQPRQEALSLRFSPYRAVDTPQ